MNNYKLIIFDMDGTLADTSPGIFNSIRYTENKMNLPEITEEQMYSHVGPPMEVSYNRNFGLEGDALKQAVSYHKEYAMMQGYKELKFYDGIVELIAKLRECGIKTAVATLKAHTTALKIFDSFGMQDTFDQVIGAKAEQPMTKAEMLVYCANQCGCDLKDTVLIGDSQYDAIGAKEAGIDFIGVTYGFGFRSHEDVMEYDNVAICDTVDDIYKFFAINP